MRSSLKASAVATLTVLFGTTAAQAAYLTANDVSVILSRAAQEAIAQNAPATIAVVDRVGSVLGVYQMTGANNFNPGHPHVIVTLDNPNGTQYNQPLSGLNAAHNLAVIPDSLGAIAKAVTGAYLSSSGGNAFSTRSASQIVQTHFNPGVANTPSGPLYGVQFSSLPCSDLNVQYTTASIPTYTRGPKRTPLGLSADPGGFPLYKNGELVGGIGAIADGTYDFDHNVFVVSPGVDEIIALAGTIGNDAPTAIQANMISVGGVTLRYSDATKSNLKSNPATASGISALPAGTGSIVSVTGYFNKTDAPGGLRDGIQFLNPASGFAQDTSGQFSTATPPRFMMNGTGGRRFPFTAGAPIAGAKALTAAEVQQILTSAYQLSLNMRGQIRNPLGSSEAVTIMVVDTNGTILGDIGNPDAPVFGVDVSLQKARTALFFSSSVARVTLSQGDLATNYLAQAELFFGSNVLEGQTAYSARAVGNLHRPTYPDGIAGTPKGPFSRNANVFTVFATGLQAELIVPDVLQHVLYVAGAASTDVAHHCSNTYGPFVLGNSTTMIANGIQIFPGGFPIYRNGVLVGGIGVSGDGVDQDDMTGFYGFYLAAQKLGNGLAHAAQSKRISAFSYNNVAPRYVNCPFSPLLSGGSQDLCNGL